MKRYKNITITAIGAVILMAGCKKYEQFPVDKVTIDYVFDSRDSLGTSAKQFLYSIYGTLQNGHNRVGGDYLDAASDDAMSSASGPLNQTTILATGAYNSYTLPVNENLWATFYGGIRKTNEFVTNIDVVPVMAQYNGKSLKYAWKAEARFLRAYFYFELVKRYGGVPLLGDKVFTIKDDVSLPRNSFEDCINYIVSECDAIKDDMPVVPLADIETERATKGAALTLKARALLYAASPLFNGGNIDASNPLTGYTAGSTARWVLASTAAKDVIDMKIGAGSDMQSYKLLANFKDVFTTQNNSEIIFMRQTDDGNGIESANAPIGFTGAPAKGQTSPSQQLVDAYPMASGLPITDPTAGYNENNPYVNRDPRLTYTIFYNNARWLNSDLQLFEGGLSKPNSSLQQTKTGYYMRKFMGASENTNSFTKHPEDWIIMRFADVKLMYAEAENEVNGATPDVYTQLKDIRLRAGIDAGANSLYGLKAGMTKDEMRTVIQNERRVEFAFEESRYWDIRRWKIAADKMNQPLKGMTIEKIGTSLTYNIAPVLTTKFNAPKMYLYPIPYDEVLKNPKMKQNPGW